MPMTDEEILLQIHDDVENLMITKYKDVRLMWFLALARPDVDSFSGNCCAICMRNRINDWIKDKQIQHVESQVEPIH